MFTTSPWACGYIAVLPSRLAATTYANRSTRLQCAPEAVPTLARDEGCYAALGGSEEDEGESEKAHPWDEVILPVCQRQAHQQRHVSSRQQSRQP